MKKKSLLVLILTVLIAVFAIGCSKSEDYKFGAYEDFTGTDPAAILQVDDYVTLDGELTESIWTESKNAVTIAGATHMQGSGTPIDVEEWGEREMTVYTHIGDKAIYFAFEVTDRNLYYNPSRAQGANSTVEIYFTSTEHTKLEPGCFSLRVSITGHEENNGTLVNAYIPTPLNDEWTISKMRGKTAAAAKVDGTVCNYDTNNFDVSNNVGYVIEAAISWDLIAEEKPTGIQYTAAFCQSAGYNRNRLNNTFIPNTNYLRPATWKLITNDGIVDDKNAFLDQSVKIEEGVTLDGKLTDTIWSGAEPRTIMLGDKRATANGGEEIYLKTYNVNTLEGVYVGFESNDDRVYGGHSDVRFNTGVELLLAVGGVTKLDGQNVIQYRYNVDGTNGANTRWFGNNTGDYPYSQAYFPAKQGGYIIGADGNEGQINISNATGWSGEIFIPWHSFNVDLNGYRDGVALIPNYYRRSAGDTVETAERKWLRAVEVNICSNGSKNVNPQAKWFLFEDGKPLYDTVGVSDIAFEKGDLVEEAGGNYYEADIFVGYTDNVATVLVEKFPGLANGSFNFESALGVTVTDKGDGYYSLKVPESSADEFGVDGKNITFTANSFTDTFNFSIDNEFALDGILNEATYGLLNKITHTQTRNGVSITNEFTVAFRKNAMYLYSVTADEKYTANKDAKALGLELYFNFGATLSSQNTYQIRLLSSGAKKNAFYNYKDTANSDGWSWDGGNENSLIERVFVDNNDGTYNIEAKIPYSVFGLTEKPEWVEICPAIKFMTTATNPNTMFFYEGNAKPSRDHGLYMRFTDGLGFTPNVYMFDENGNSINGINLIKGIGLVGGNYQGTAKLSYVYDGNLPVLDAEFDATYASFITNNGDGTYTYSIPEVAFNSVDTHNIAWTSALARGTIVTKASALSQIYLSGSNVIGSSNTAINAYPHAKVTVGGTDYYDVTVKVYADEERKIGVPSTHTVVAFGVEGVDGVVTNALADNAYQVLIPVSEVTANTAYAINATATNITGANITFTAKVLSNEKQQALIDNALVYLDMNGNVSDKVGGHETTLLYGSASYGSDEYFKANQKDRAINVKGLDLAGKSFTLSMLVNGDDMRNTYHDGYANLLFANTNVDRQIKTVDNMIRLRFRGFNLNGGTGQPKAMFGLVFNTKAGVEKNIDLLDLFQYLGGWNRLTFTLDFSVAGNVTVNVYVDGALRKTQTVTGLGTDFALNSTTWGVGGPAVWHDINGADVNQRPYTGNNTYYGIDDVMIIEGVLDAESVLALPGYINQTVQATGFDVADIFFEQSDLNEGAYSCAIAPVSYSGMSLEGLTLVNAPAGVTLTGNTLAFTANAVNALNGTTTLTAKIGNATKTFEVTYVPYTTLYANDETVYDADEKSGNISLTVKVSADEDMISSVAGATLTASTIADLTVVDNGDGTYALTAPATSFASATSHTVTVTLGTVSTEFTINYKKVENLAPTAFLDFNGGDVTNRINGSVSTKVGTVTTVEGKDGSDAVKLITGKQAAVNVSATLGSDDFTLAFTTKIVKSQVVGGNGAAGYELINSGANVDADADTVQVSIMQTAADSGIYQFRIQLGKNISQQRFVVILSEEQANAWLDSWIDFALVVDRDCTHEQTPNNNNGITFAETAYAYVYVNGELIHTNRLIYGSNQTLGDGTIRLGGHLTWKAGKEHYMDNFVLFNRVASKREINLLGAYANCWNALS